MWWLRWLCVRFIFCSFVRYCHKRWPFWMRCTLLCAMCVYIMPIGGFFVYGYSFLFHFASISRSLHAPVHLFPYTKAVVWCFTLHSHETPKLTLTCVIRLGSSKKTWIALKSSLFSSISLDYRNSMIFMKLCNAIWRMWLTKSENSGKNYEFRGDLN